MNDNGSVNVSSSSKSALSLPTLSRWHHKDKPYCQRLRLRLEARLGDACSYCGLTRNDGVNLQFHHHAGRDYSIRKLSWKQRLMRYQREIDTGELKYLACDQTGNNCHENRKRDAPNQPVKLYEYPS